MEGLLSGSDVCHLFGCLCSGGVSRPGIQLFREIAFLDKEVEFQPEAVKLKGVYRHIGERLFPYLWLKGVVPLLPGWGCSEPSGHVHGEQ